MKSEWVVEVEAAQEPKPEKLLAHATVNGVSGFKVWRDALSRAYVVFPAKRSKLGSWSDDPKALALVGGKFGTGAAVASLKDAVLVAWAAAEQAKRRA